jgi:hypothetical protein
MAEVVDSIDLRSVYEIPESDVARGTFVAIAGSNLPVKNFLAGSIASLEMCNCNIYKDFTNISLFLKDLA